MEALVQELLDKQALHEVLMRYCRGVDRVDKELLSSAYHPDAYDDHGYYQGDASGFVDVVLAHQHEFRYSMHTILNESFRIDGDSAYGESYNVTFQVHDPTPSGEESTTISGCRYLDRFERRGGEWRIAHRRVIIEFRACPGHWRTPRNRRYQRGQRDVSDPSYEFGLFGRSSR